MKHHVLWMALILLSVHHAIAVDSSIDKDGNATEQGIARNVAIRGNYQAYPATNNQTHTNHSKVSIEKNIFDAMCVPTPEYLSPDSSNYQQGTLDAMRMYPRKHTGAGVTYLVTALVDPLIGLIPALVYTSNPPKQVDLGIVNADKFDDEEYLRGYTDQANKMKKKKVWTSFGIGTATYAVLLVILLSSN